MHQKSNQLIWIWCTSDADNGRIQIDTTISNKKLEVVEEGPRLHVQVEGIDPSLTSAFPVKSLQPREVLTLREAEEQILTYVRRHTTAMSCLLASEMTRNVRTFLETEMKELAAHFFYKSFDVCTFRELYKRWKSEEIATFARPIDEMRFYREELILKPGIQKASDERIIWIDCEMTGLELGVHRIVEIACVVTDPNLEVIDVSNNFVIKQPLEVMRMMNEWCRKTFKKNGLTEDIEKSCLSAQDVENQLLEFLSLHCGNGVCPLGGNSVHVDRRFITQDFPKLAEFIGRSDIDVTAVSGMIYLTSPIARIRTVASTNRCHRALDDILRSISIMRTVYEQVRDDMWYGNAY